MALKVAAQSLLNPTSHTLTLCRQMLDYCATFPTLKLCYCTSVMILHIDSDAAYLIAPQAKSRIAGYFQLNNKTYPSNPSMPLHGAILVEYNTICHLVASTVESERKCSSFSQRTTCLPYFIYAHTNRTSTTSNSFVP